MKILVYLTVLYLAFSQIQSRSEERRVGTDTKFNSGSKLLKKDDLVVMYTDGVFEAVSPVNKEYGEERLMDLIVKNRNLEINEICLSILSDLEVFEQGSRFDDVTLVALRKN